MSYWGGKNGLNVSQVECTLKSVSHIGNSYRLVRRCEPIQGGKSFNDIVNVVIPNSNTFTYGRMAFRWCASSMQ
jgi:hypothetical protein